MKKIFVALLGLLLSSCVAMRVKYSEQKFIYDFRSYALQGFMISPVTTGFSYEPIATISMNFKPGWNDEVKGQISSSDDLYGDRSVFKKGEYINPSPEYMLEHFVQYAKSIGATGILNFDADAIYHYQVLKNGISITTLQYYKLSGFAVKIKEE